MKIMMLIVVLSILVMGCPAVRAENMIINNQEWENPQDRTGDNDGNSFVIYSRPGYNGADGVLDFAGISSNFARKSDGKTINSFLFFGVDVLDDEGGWINCADAGFCKNGNGEWHLFINRYQGQDQKWYADSTWWESAVELDGHHTYRLQLSTAAADELMELSVYDLDRNGIKVDSMAVRLKYAKKDGSNTAYYRDLAIDYPEDVCFDTAGNPSRDWVQVTEYNWNQGLYIKGIHFRGVRLHDNAGAHEWTDGRTASRFMWPEALHKVPYITTSVRVIKRDSEDIVNFDLNN